MASEETPLLAEQSTDADALKHDLFYTRFAPAQKRVIVALVSAAGVIPLLAVGSLIPAIPVIAREFDSSGPIINLAVSLSIFAAAIGSMCWSAYSGVYGRRPIYIVSIPLLCLGSAGVATSRNVTELFLSRFMQAFGCSSAMTVGAGVIGDIYRLEERGTAMGLFFGASLVGPAVAPLMGGAATHYASWRDAHWALMIMGLLVFVPIVTYLPETLDPEKLNESRGPGKKFQFLNPFKCLALLRSPNITLTALAGATTLVTDYALLVPLSYTIAKQYNITNEAIIGAFFLPTGLGNIIGAPLSGHYSDHVVIKWRKQRSGMWIPEDRLRATLFGSALLVPLSTLLSGVTTTYVSGTPGIIINLCLLFVNGMGVDFVLSPSAAYYVDVMHSRSAEVMAATMALRSLSTAFITAAMLPLINTIGLVGANGIVAGLAWSGFLALVMVIKHGDRMRAWVDIGYSTAQTN